MQERKIAELIEQKHMAISLQSSLQLPHYIGETSMMTWIWHHLNNN